jgi:hypothetical protein
LTVGSVLIAMTATRLQPLIDFAAVRVGSSALVMEMAMHRESFVLFPALDGTDVAFQVRGDLFPRVEPLAERLRVLVGRRAVHQNISAVLILAGPLLAVSCAPEIARSSTREVRHLASDDRL